MKEEGITVNGKAVEARGNATFLVRLENGHELLARVCGKMVKNNIRVNVDDNVIVEMPPYDLTHGRIIYRTK